MVEQGFKFEDPQAVL